MTDPTIDIVKSQSALERICEAIDGAACCFFDTEFLREKTYYPQLCLMQVRCAENIWLIDPLADIRLDDFYAALFATKLVMHSGRQDLEVLKISAGKLPNRIFDTQIAAGLTGLSPQIGYAKLVEQYCDVSLDKAHTRTNWSRRPLAEDVLQYAADDVRYLPRVHDALYTTLDKLNRLEWAEQDAADMLSPALYDNPTELAWQRVRGFGNLPTALQQRVMLLADWRERVAQQSDRPRQWILRDEPLINLAALSTVSADTIATCDGVHPKFAQRHHQAIIETLALPAPDAPAFAARPDDDERARSKRMAASVRAVAGDVGVEAEVLAPRRELNAAARGNHDLRALSGWRNAVVGDQIRAEMP
ncbi:MAG: HRDC domain-containing protein [Pseudomonadota bacterium]